MKFIFLLFIFMFGNTVASDAPRLGPITAIGPSYMAEKITLGEPFEIPLIIGANVAFWSSNNKQDRQPMTLTLVGMTRQKLLFNTADNEDAATEVLGFEFEISNKSNKERGKLLLPMNYYGDELFDESLEILGKKIIYHELLLDLGRNILLLEVRD